MELNILQGVNHINDRTTIIVSNPTPLFRNEAERIVNIHPLFGEIKKNSEKELQITSELTHLWKEIVKSHNEKPDMSAKHFTEETNAIIYRQILSMSTIPVLYRATQMGYEITQFYLKEGVIMENGRVYNRYYCIGHGRQSEVTVSIASTKDSYLSTKTQRDKWLTNSIVERLGLPIPRWELIESREHVKELFNKYKKPFIIKPTGLTGGHGVTTGIHTLQQAEKAYDMAMQSINCKDRAAWQRKVMIQDQVKSVANEDYRLLVINGKLEAATKRIPARVTGDGKSTIQQLIEETNKDPRRDKSNPTHTLKPIVIDEILRIYLDEQGFSLQYVPQNGEVIYVRKTSSMSQGGITEDVTDIVHPQIKNIVESIASSIHAYTMGADIMCLDIGKPLTPDNGAILEVNTMPESYLNIYPVIGESREYIIDNYIKGLLGNKDKCNVVVIVGKVGSIEEILKKANCDRNERVGIYWRNSLFINGVLLSDGQEVWSAIESLKLNASLDKIVVVYENQEEVMAYGTGFNQIDSLITDDQEIQKKFGTHISSIESM